VGPVRGPGLRPVSLLAVPRTASADW
jgi:hypothetical protein